MDSSNASTKEIKNPRVIFKNLKSDYFLVKIFDNLLRKRSLEIVKFNKYLRERMNMSIKDYKEYAEKFSSIELEIKLVKNNYGNFINYDINNEQYYHIYFDNNEEEIGRSFLIENEDINSIKIIIGYQVESFKELFIYCECIESIYFKKFFRNNITNMCSMFSGCASLKELNLSNFNTENVTDMSWMFSRCSSLKELNLSNFKTENVTDMSVMFSDCSSLKELNLSNFNTNNVTEMDNMFNKCSSLEEINLSNFNTEKVTNMSWMFNECSSLKKLDISNFNTNNVVHINKMFNGCSEQLIMEIKAKYKNIKEEAFI